MTTYIKSTLVLLTLFFLLPGLAAAQALNVARLDAKKNRVYTNIGLDPAVIATAGYARSLPVWNRMLALSGEVALPIAELDVQDFRARVAAQTSLVRYHDWHLVGHLSLLARGTENDIYRAVNLGVDLTGYLGYYRQRWSLAFAFGYDRALTSHLTHSAWYRTYFYGDVRDGWYHTPGGTLHYGLLGSIAVGPTELTLRLGKQQTAALNPVDPPFYSTLTLTLPF